MLVSADDVSFALETHSPETSSVLAQTCRQTTFARQRSQLIGPEDELVQQTSEPTLPNDQIEVGASHVT